MQDQDVVRRLFFFQSMQNTTSLAVIVNTVESHCINNGDDSISQSLFESLLYSEVPTTNTHAFQQGKVAELRLELNSGGKKDKNHSAKKITLKKIVANMTMSNNDMVALFPDVVGCMQIPSLEIKKMYVIPPDACE